MLRHLSLFLLSCFLCIDGELIGRRSLDTFGHMIKSITGRNPLDFNGYGNWCGFGGGGDPVDLIDNCCKDHDHCYRRVNEIECNSLTRTKVYFASYHWYKHQGTVYCLNNDECPQAACGCDKKAVTCFRNHMIEYNESNQSPIGKIIGGLFNTG